MIPLPPSWPDTVGRVRRVLVKIGTAVLSESDGRIDRARLVDLVQQLASIHATRQVVVVTSGAIALGVERLGLRHRPRDIPSRQAAAAVGQARLMRLYDDAFGDAGIVAAQVLLTHADIQSRARYLNARRTLDRLLEHGVVPVINENDTVSVEELRFGDNDALAGMAVDVVGADLLVILTDVDGVYSADPRHDPTARRLPVLSQIDEAVLRGAGGARSGVGTGGMASKLRAAQRASWSGIPTVIAGGRTPAVLRRIMDGEPVGTRVDPQIRTAAGRQRWMGRDVRPQGTVWIDAGARRAIVDQHRSLLPGGVTRLTDTFSVGDVIEVRDTIDETRIVARGITGWSSTELGRVVGLAAPERRRFLADHRLPSALIHRDRLVVLVASGGDGSMDQPVSVFGSDTVSGEQS